MNVEVDLSKSEKFKVLYNLPKGTNTIILIGGRGGMKTYEASKFIAYSATIQLKRCAVLRDERELVRESILNEILLRYDTANETGILDTRFERQANGIKDKKTGEMLVFTKGFRASDLQKRANLKSISNVDIALIEEAEDIRDQDRFNTFNDSIRKENSLIIIILNTPDINHWIVKRYFNLTQVEDGFYRIEPKKIDGFVCIQTSYKDNKYLPQHIVDRYEAYGDINSHLYNPYYYKTAILGYASTGRKGQILTKVKPISLKDYLALPFKEGYGQDFGTASPAGMVGVKFDRNTCYARQINYLPMSTLSLGKLYCELKFGNTDKIIADNADKEAIKKLKGGFDRSELSQELIEKYPNLLKGFFIEPCKNKDIEFRLGLMNSMNLYAVEESKDLWNEILNYVYAQDKNGNYTNEPIDDYNHLIDAWGYCVADHYGQPKKGSAQIREFGS